MISIYKALQISGWMTMEELTWLAEQAAHHALIVEVGSYVGRSTRALGDNTPGKVVAVDDWYGPRRADSKPLPPECGSNDSSGVPWTPEERAELYDQFLTNVNDLILDGKVEPYKINHADVPESYNIIPDMVFVDGDHLYESVKRDIQIWLPRLAPGGLFCGHDGNQGCILAAAKEAFPELDFAGDTTIWYAFKENQ